MNWNSTNFDTWVIVILELYLWCSMTPLKPSQRIVRETGQRAATALLMNSQSDRQMRFISFHAITQPYLNTSMHYKLSIVYHRLLSNSSSHHAWRINSITSRNIEKHRIQSTTIREQDPPSQPRIDCIMAYHRLTPPRQEYVAQKATKIMQTQFAQPAKRSGGSCQAMKWHRSLLSAQLPPWWHDLHKC